jgi:leucyl-tRNA synthetase
MVLGKTYKDVQTDRYLMPGEIDILKESDGSETPIIKKSGQKANVVWEKMSKSKFNGVDPDTIISKYGADVTRLASLFKAPPEQALEWDEGAVAGQSRWCDRLRRLTKSVLEDDHIEENDGKKDDNNEIAISVNQCVASVTECFETAGSFNVAIAQLMKLSNVLSSKESKLCKHDRKIGLKKLLIMLTPFAPHLACELYEQLGQGDKMTWPTVDQSKVQINEITVVFQIQGKKKMILDIPSSIASSKDQLLNYINANDVKSRLKLNNDKDIQKIIIVPSKDGGKRPSIVNFVLR